VTASKEHTRRHFDRWAPRYEADRTSRRLADPQRRALEALDLKADDRLLDVGCGSGAAVRLAAQTVRRAVGIDLSPAMIVRATELAGGADHVEFGVGDSEQLPFADGEFTAVLCTTSFHHYPDPAGAVGEMARVLDAGGRVAIGDPTADQFGVRLLDAVLRRFQAGHVGFQRTADRERLLAGAGLALTRIERLWHGGYAIVVARKAD
jgi:ubiquinone/menaquinone biosynthesis C-methylase UbiE